MDFIVADQDKREQGILTNAKMIDFDLGNKNDFEVTLDLDEWAETSYSYGCMVYANQTEYGGIIEDMKVDTKNNSIKLKGYTWRGLLTQKIIEPPSDQPYLIVSGDANTVLRAVIGSSFGDLFMVEDELSGLIVNYQFNRYTNMLDGFLKMLKTVDAKLQICFDNMDMYVHIKAVPIFDYSDELEYSQDNQISFTSRDYRRGINHLICLGPGELMDREVMHLYLQEDGRIGSSKYYSGLSERTSVYDYANAEDENELLSGALKRFGELLNFSELAMNIEEINAEIGDVVGGRERISGLSIKKPIIQKILKVTGNNETIQFKVGD